MRLSAAKSSALKWSLLGRNCVRKGLRHVWVVGPSSQALLWVKSWLQEAPCDDLVVVSNDRPAFLFPIPRKNFRWAELQHLSFHESLSIAASLDRRPSAGVLAYEYDPSSQALKSLVDTLAQGRMRTFALTPTLSADKLAVLLRRPDSGILYLQNEDFETAVALSEQTQAPYLLERLAVTEALWCETRVPWRKISLASAL